MDKRRIAHNAYPARKGLEMEVIASGLDFLSSRALEQAGMAYYHAINRANKRNNQINGISPKFWDEYNIAEGVINYSYNQLTNEILCWIEP